MSKRADNVRPAARAIRGVRGIDATARVLPESIASPAWSKARRVAIWIVALGLLCALIFVFAANYGYSRWMNRSEFLSLLKEHDGMGTWITAVEGRWKDGSWQMRIREEPAPKHKKFAWSWGYNITGSVFFDRLSDHSSKDFTLTHQQSYTWPDGTKMYQAVWQKIEGQEK